MDGKIVAELAKELNVAVQTIYKRLNKFKTIKKDSKGRKIVTPAQEEEIRKEITPTKEQGTIENNLGSIIYRVDGRKSRPSTL